MLAHQFTIWRLKEHADSSLGLACDGDGLFWGRTPLIEKQSDGFVVKPRNELERLFESGLGFDVVLESRMARLEAIAEALNKGNLCSATI